MSCSPEKFCDYYGLLNIQPSSHGVEIRRAYMKLAKSLHPDLDGGDAVKMQQLNQAYQTLKDDSKRRVYDMMHQANTGTSQLFYRYGGAEGGDGLASKMTDEEVDEFLNSVILDFKAQQPPKKSISDIKSKLAKSKITFRKPKKKS